MKRLGLLLLFLVVALDVLRGEAQTPGKVHRVSFILTDSPIAKMMGPEPAHAPFRAFLHEMRGRGYVEGQNLILARRSLEGRYERASEVVAELIRLKVDVIVSLLTPVIRDVRRVTTTVPIVMAASSAPVEAGLVASLARPGGNVTGLTSDTGPELEGKRLEILKEGVRGVSRVAFIGTSADWENERGQGARAAARALGLTLFLAEHGLNDYTGAFGVIARERPDALVTSFTPHHYVHRRLIIEFAAKNRLPAMYSFREFVEAGGLISYGADLRDNFRRAAIYVDRILKGAKPGDLPIEQPTKFELVVNMKTAKALGLTIPQTFLMRADEVIK